MRFTSRAPGKTREAGGVASLSDASYPSGPIPTPICGGVEGKSLAALTSKRDTPLGSLLGSHVLDKEKAL